MQKTIFYLFVLAFALIALAYWAGGNQLLQTTFAGINTLGLTFTGRDQQGQFASYPANQPTA